MSVAPDGLDFSLPADSFAPLPMVLPGTVQAPVNLDFSSVGSALTNLTKSITDITGAYYGTQQQIAQQQNALAIAKARGVANLTTAQVGLPGTGILLLGGAALLVLLLTSGGGKSRR